jgi:hypothetical protein
VNIGPDGEPVMTMQEAETFTRDFADDPDYQGLTIIEDSTGAGFLAVNRGVSDDGAGLRVDFIARITDYTRPERYKT